MSAKFAELIFEILNDSNVYIVVLDRTITIRYINYPLANKIGFKNEEEAIGRCWLDFVPEKSHDNIKTVHASILYNGESEYREYCNEVLALDDTLFKVKWYNTAINHNTFWTFSFGLPIKESTFVTEKSFRTHFKSMIESDKTIIKSLKDFVAGVPDKFNIETCELPKENENSF